MFAVFVFFQRHGLSWVVGGCDAKGGDLRRNNEGRDIGLNWILTGFEPHSVSPKPSNDLRNSLCAGAAKSGAVPVPRLPVTAVECLENNQARKSARPDWILPVNHQILPRRKWSLAWPVNCGIIGSYAYLAHLSAWPHMAIWGRWPAGVSAVRRGGGSRGGRTYAPLLPSRFSERRHRHAVALVPHGRSTATTKRRCRLRNPGGTRSRRNGSGV
jgi:hypothetical protein